MGAVVGWAVADDDLDIDLTDMAVIDGGVRVEVNPRSAGDNVVFFSPKQAREFARDLNAAAKVASSK